MKKIGILLISIFVCFLLIEIFFRVLYPQSGYSVTYSEYGWRHLPNTSVKFYGEQAKFGWGQRAVKVKYNWDGLRSPNYIYQHKQYQFCDTLYDYERIMLLGDSWLEDMGSPRDNLVNIYLQKHINFTYRDELLPKQIPIYQVINAGHHGFDNAQELMWYFKEGRKYSPDIVIVFYAGDKANLENATIEDNKLVLKWYTFTTKQKVYKNIVSWIRLHTHFGSWLLDRLQRLERIKHYLVKEGMKEPDNPIVNHANYIKDESDFMLIDKMIYQRLAAEVEKDGAVLIMLNCMGDWSRAQKKFFKDNGVYHMFIPSEWPGEGDKLRNRDKKFATLCEYVYHYEPQFESHRFGYMQNKRVAERIMEFLREEGLL